MTQNNIKNNNYLLPLTLIGILFCIFGFVTWSNSQLIPYFKIACELTDAQSYLVASAFFAAYFFVSIPSSYILKWSGYKKGICIGLLTMAIGTAIFIPAAKARSYPLFLTGLFVIGSGLALLQTAANPYVTVLGPIESAAKRISIMGICNKLAGILAIFSLGKIVLHDADGLKAKLLTMPVLERTQTLNQIALRVISPYTIWTVVLVLFAVIFFFLPLPEIKEEEVEHIHEKEKQKNIFQYPYMWLGVIALFFYVGVEVISYDSFAGFGEALGYSLEKSKSFATYTGYALLVGYFLSIILIPKVISQRIALIWAVLLSILFVILSIILPKPYSIVAFALLGLSNSPIWPAIWPLSLDMLGKHTKIAGALLVMGIVGGAVLPPIYGKFSEWIGANYTNLIRQQWAYLIMIPAYLFILYFALMGYKKGKSETQ